ncbi:MULTISPECIES: GFA family protein [unclassified Achromobacter]|uniref:GFA family protein n=1 Tax=unclassified Achromobacter TaxID=2626865 RepID=UPI00069E4CA7|nr:MULTISPECIES: GFA family protein [unclassified Achromobacter]KOF52768.1 aldehyde-activating protein [Achromobacter sp. DMS1]
MIKGSCLCGRVAYAINGPLTDAVNCHCVMCRKAHGAAFRSRATVQAGDFSWTKGENHVTWYSSSPGHYRGFCEACGTPLLTRFDQQPDVYGLALGALDDDPGVKPMAHCHVASKAPWYDITDDLPQYPGAIERAPQPDGEAA